MSAHAETVHDHGHHGPPPANQSSRLDPTTLGMFLFIASEAMLFGAFFTAYFFVRVVNPDAPAVWPPPPYEFPVFVATVNTAILVTSSFTIHWATQSHVVREDGGPIRRILVVANETVAGHELQDLLGHKAEGVSEDVLLVCPALNSKLRTWTSDEDGARAAAQSRLDTSLTRLAQLGVQARGEIGDGDPLQALEDALREFPADEIVVSTHPPGRSHWLELGVVENARMRYDVPVTHVVVDLEIA